MPAPARQFFLQVPVMFAWSVLDISVQCVPDDAATDVHHVASDIDMHPGGVQRSSRVSQRTIGERQYSVGYREGHVFLSGARGRVALRRHPPSGVGAIERRRYGWHSNGEADHPTCFSGGGPSRRYWSNSRLIALP